MPLGWGRFPRPVGDGLGGARGSGRRRGWVGAPPCPTLDFGEKNKKTTW